MSPFERLKELQTNLEGFFVGSENEKIFWEAIAQEAKELASFARKQSKAKR